jgi:hypothetical protein
MSWDFRTYWGEERCIQGFLGQPELKTQLGRPKRRWGIILKWIFNNFLSGYGLDKLGSR